MSLQVYMVQQLIIITLMSQHPGRTIRCPFDPNHVMPYDRFLNHLDKCKFADKKSYAKCRYNPYHVFHKETIADHEKKCEDRKKYEAESDDDSWGVEDDLQKPEKSTVSTSVTTLNSKYNTKPAEKIQVTKYNSGQAIDFDGYDFLANKSRQ